MPARHENEIFARDGARRLISWNNIILFDTTGKPIGTASVGQDIIESRRVEEALRGSEETFREMSKTLRDVVWVMNATADEIVYVNPAYEQIWGQRCKSLYQNPMFWFDVIRSEDQERSQLLFEKQMRGELIESEYRIRTPDGQERWISDRAFPIRDHAGQLIRVLGIAQDITGRKQAEAALRTLSRRPIILVVDDDEAGRRTVHTYAEEVGYEVLIARDGREAISTAAAKRPDLLITDIFMPQMDGFEVIEYFRRMCPATKISPYPNHRTPTIYT
jgi:PAS domain S-box-containing protein